MLLDAGRTAIGNLQKLPSWEAQFSYRGQRTPALVKWWAAQNVSATTDPILMDARVAVQKDKHCVEALTLDKDGKTIFREVATWTPTEYTYYQEFQGTKQATIESVTKDVELFPSIQDVWQQAKNHVTYTNIDGYSFGYYGGKDKGLDVFVSTPETDGYWQSVALDPDKDLTPVTITKSYTGKKAIASATYSGYRKREGRWVADRLTYEMLLPGGGDLAKIVTSCLKSFQLTPDAAFLNFAIPPGTVVHDRIRNRDYIVPEQKKEPAG